MPNFPSGTHTSLFSSLVRTSHGFTLTRVPTAGPHKSRKTRTVFPTVQSLWLKRLFRYNLPLWSHRCRTGVMDLLSEPHDHELRPQKRRSAAAHVQPSPSSSSFLPDVFLSFLSLNFLSDFISFYTHFPHYPLLFIYLFFPTSFLLSSLPFSRLSFPTTLTFLLHSFNIFVSFCFLAIFFSILSQRLLPLLFPHSFHPILPFLTFFLSFPLAFYLPPLPLLSFLFSVLLPCLRVFCIITPPQLSSSCPSSSLRPRNRFYFCLLLLLLFALLSSSPFSLQIKDWTSSRQMHRCVA